MVAIRQLHTVCHEVDCITFFVFCHAVHTKALNVVLTTTAGGHCRAGGAALATAYGNAG
jgi:hypothetical protein